tara:strand:- start:17 stop:1411 length:1395 start_codon:yes stop_codon:yes gene_type:complete
MSKSLSVMLNQIKIWQYHIEDVAQTPGNYPALDFSSRYVQPAADKIYAFSATLIELEKKLEAKDKFIIIYDLADFRDHFSQTLQQLANYAVTGDVLNLNQAKHQLKLSDQSIGILEPYVSQFTPDQQAHYHQLLTQLQYFHYLFDQLVSIRQSKPANLSAYWLKQKAVPLARAANQLIDQMSAVQAVQLDSRLDKITFLSNTVIIVVILLIILLLLFSIILAMFFAKRLLYPIRLLMQATEKLASGKAVKNIPVEVNDEIGKLTSSFNSMREQLSQQEKELKAYAQDLKESNEHIKHIAYHDALTGLPNRRYFSEYVEKALARAKRNQFKIGFFMLDLDGFKDVNDEYGHKYGDVLLKEVTSYFSALLRKGDVLSRLGGDEFILLVEHLNRGDEEAIAQKFLTGIREESFSVIDKTVNITCSVGISIYPDDAKSFASLLKYADKALYAAKAAGKDMFKKYSNNV